MINDTEKGEYTGSRGLPSKASLGDRSVFMGVFPQRWGKPQETGAEREAHVMWHVARWTESARVRAVA